ncbi:hypothetical protein HPB47_011558 [Ixodes persulcatus]|uniref:Uncharacterized protein n=1 Tax=Ixodes persulcatus TaxID=34615 RepID=A0AC60NW49_IXOPE|nr:hypothetical protein HPB47_011558 [Ixodes persulcatus]
MKPRDPWRRVASGSDFGGRTWLPNGYIRVKGVKTASLFIVPKDSARRDLWEKNLQRSDKHLEETSDVCELHFEPRFILRDYVHIIGGKEVRIPCGHSARTPDAVPTLLPGVLQDLSGDPPAGREEWKWKASPPEPIVAKRLGLSRETDPLSPVVNSEATAEIPQGIDRDALGSLNTPNPYWTVHKHHRERSTSPGSANPGGERDPGVNTAPVRRPASARLDFLGTVDGPSGAFLRELLIDRRMDVQVISEDITPEEVTAEMGWRTAHSRRPDKKRGQTSSHDDPPQSQDSHSRSKTRKNVKSQVLKAGRMPQLPKNEIKIIVRPKGALNIPKVGSPTVTSAIFQATPLSPEESQDDTICPNVQQNIVVISTPRPHNADRYVRMKSIHVNVVTHEVNAYEAAPDNTTKGVIRGIPLTDSAQEIDANIINARNPLALAAKRIGSTTTTVIAFDGPSVPHLVRYAATLIPCSLYRKQIDMCYHCGRLGHRMDVYHQCTPKCTLCGGPHPTADKGCTAKYKTPYVIRKRLWEQRTAQQSVPQPGDFPPIDTNHRSRSRSRQDLATAATTATAEPPTTAAGTRPAARPTTTASVAAEGPVVTAPPQKRKAEENPQPRDELLESLTELVKAQFDALNSKIELLGQRMDRIELRTTAIESTLAESRPAAAGPIKSTKPYQRPAAAESSSDNSKATGGPAHSN